MTDKNSCPDCGASNASGEPACSLCGSDLEMDRIPAESQSDVTRKTGKSDPVPSPGFSIWAVITGFLIAGVFLSFLSITEYDSGAGLKTGGQLNETHLSTKPDAVLSESLESWIADQEKQIKNSTNEVIKTLSTAVADSLIKYESFERAGNWLEKVFNLDSTEVSLSLKIGNLYYDANRMDLAIPFYKIFLRHNPDNTDARVDMATAMISASSSPMEAVAELKKVLSINKNHQIANLNLGVLYFRINKYDQAKQYLTQAKTINPENKAGKTAADMLEQIVNMKK